MSEEVILTQSEAEIKKHFETIQNRFEEEAIIWKGYTFQDVKNKKAYITLVSKTRFKELWEKFESWKGSQKDFYFRFVNRMKSFETVEKIWELEKEKMKSIPKKPRVFRKRLMED